MSTPHVMQCPDGHFRRAIFQLGPFIADYPEQVCLAGVVSGWCPKYVIMPLEFSGVALMNIRCRAFPDDLDQPGRPRFKEHTDYVINTFTARTVWDVFGLNPTVTVSELIRVVQRYLYLIAPSSLSPLTFHALIFTSSSPLIYYINSSRGPLRTILSIGLTSTSA